MPAAAGTVQAALTPAAPQPRQAGRGVAQHSSNKKSRGQPAASTGLRLQEELEEAARLGGELASSDTSDDDWMLPGQQQQTPAAAAAVVAAAAEPAAEPAGVSSGPTRVVYKVCK
uniref:Uncharacterized protein n=1 Tax=Tetradesmus obliquus TaxID=3088 RepID=A0A383VJP8_TETOB|eukprot:jgi/Sobl393_1/19953/SZX64884.1